MFKLCVAVFGLMMKRRWGRGIYTIFWAGYILWYDRQGRNA